MTTKEQMPELPEPFGSLERSGMWNGSIREGRDDVFDAEQMHAHALAYADARGGAEVACEIGECAEVHWLNGGPSYFAPGTKLYTTPPRSEEAAPASGEAVKEAMVEAAAVCWYELDREDSWQNASDRAKKSCRDDMREVLIAALAARGGE